MNIQIRTRTLKSGSKSIYLDFYDSGKRWYEYLGLYIVQGDDTESKRQNADAMKKAVEEKAMRMLGIEEEIASDNTNGNIPKRVFSDWMDEYLKGMFSNRHFSMAYCRNVKSNVNLVKSYLVYRHRPRMLMKKIDKSFIKGLFEYWKNVYSNTKSLDDKGLLSPHTLRLHQGLFTRMLNEAVREGVLISNPFYALSPKERMPEVKSERDYLTKEEINILAKIQTTNECVRHAFLFCCFTGLRYSDVYSLTWGNIKHTSLGMVIVLSAMRKTGRSVTIPLNKSALTWLPERHGQPMNKKVFDGLVSLSQCDRVLKQMATVAGIQKRVSYHTSRHTFATLTLAAGGDIYTVGKLLGHQSINSTQIYAEVIDGSKINAINCLNNYFDNH